VYVNLCGYIHFFFMAQAKFYLEKRGDKTTQLPILMAYSFHGQRLIYYTGVRVDKKFYTQNYWKGNGKPPIKVTAPQAEFLNTQLSIIKSHLGAAENEAKAAGMPLSVSYFRQYLDSKLKEKPKPDTITLMKYYDIFIEGMKNGINQKTGHPLSGANIEKYTASKNMLKDFCQYRGREVNFEDVDEAFYNELITYMISVKKYALNTYGRHIKFLKTILHRATQDGINTNLKFQKALVGVTEPSENAYLTEEELETLRKHDFSGSPRLERVRDFFLVGCWTGLRFSDYTNLKKENITANNMIKILTQKTKKQVIIPLHPVVKEILEKYDYQLPPAISNQKFNDYIQAACQQAEIKSLFTKNITRAGKVQTMSGKKYEFISSHSARRTFATNAYKRKIPILLIMSITGHRTETEFLKYIKITDEERAELFAQEAKW